MNMYFILHNTYGCHYQLQKEKGKDFTGTEVRPWAGFESRELIREI